MLLSQMVLTHEAFVQARVSAFMGHSNYYLVDLREDLKQAARLGIIKSFHSWDPSRGAFTTHAWFKVLHELQEVAKHAVAVTHPRRADIPPSVQEAAAAHYAQTGEDADLTEMGIRPAAIRRAEAAGAAILHADDSWGGWENVVNTMAIPTEDVLVHEMDVARVRKWALMVKKEDLRGFSQHVADLVDVIRSEEAARGDG